MSDKDAKIFFEKALKFFNEKKFDLVEKNFEEALKLAPGRVSILENLASIYFINKKTNHSLINIGTSKEHSIKKIANKILKILDLDIKIKFDNNSKYCFSLKKTAVLFLEAIKS